jgi:hypothetical protein
MESAGHQKHGLDESMNVRPPHTYWALVTWSWSARQASFQGGERGRVTVTTPFGDDAAQRIVRTFVNPCIPQPNGCEL